MQYGITCKKSPKIYAVANEKNAKFKMAAKISKKFITSVCIYRNKNMITINRLRNVSIYDY